MPINADETRKRHNSEDQEPRMTQRDWRQALNNTHSYKAVNGKINFQTKFVFGVILIGVMILIILYNFFQMGSDNENIGKPYVSLSKRKIIHNNFNNDYKFNGTYPLTFPKLLPEGLVQFRIGIIADLDTSSKSDSKSNLWISYFKMGNLIWNSGENQVIVNWDENLIKLKSGYGLSGRGMELSELIVFDGKLLCFDDRTGFVYQLFGNSVIPWIILVDGNGKQGKGLKTEWATVKDEKIYVGGSGKEWTTEDGKYLNDNPMWVKIILPTGEVKHVNWKENYKKLRKAVDIEFPGYMIHEAVCWSRYHNKWFFLPRRASQDSYNDATDEYKSTNILLSADPNFDNIKVTHIGDIVPLRGYSSFKFIPSTNDQVIVALKTEELNKSCATYITSFTIDGKILLPETKFADTKFEGIEFI